MGSNKGLEPLKATLTKGASRQERIEMKKTRSKRLPTFAGYLILLAIMGMAGLFSLSLLGPAVGNVFSNIVNNCTGCGTGMYSSGLPAARVSSPTLVFNPPNAAPYDDVFYENYGVNPFIDTEDDPLSTFALDVDTGSYTVMRRYLKDGNLPDKDSVRVEEYLNYFDLEYPLPQEDAFAIYMDGGPTPFVQNENYQVLRVGIQGYDIPAEERTDVVLTFVVDVSGSMADGGRLDAVKASLAALVKNLRPSDRVGIVAFSETAWVVLPTMPVGERGEIMSTLAQLWPMDGTNAEAGLKLGYQLAQAGYDYDALNRVILCSDGVANTGNTGAKDILRAVEDYVDQGITLTTVGFGMGNYNDVLLEQLANKGDGVYAYVDGADEAKRLFVDDLTGLLQFIAMDAKVQVEFNSEVVSRYRLLGYENRRMKDEDFFNDEADAGEIGAGLSVTALYEVKLVEGAAGEIGSVSMRWTDPDSGESKELSESIGSEDLVSTFDQASPSFQLAVIVAEFAEVLRESYWAQEFTLQDVADWSYMVDLDELSDQEVDEFLQLVHLAAVLDTES
jgi:Ca-activated chloride channel family protein